MASDAGHALAQLWLGETYECGHGVERCGVNGFEFMLAAASQGHADAQYEVGASAHISPTYLPYQVVQVPYNHAYALLQVGLAYENGRGTVQSYAKAFEWYKCAALQGNAIATYSIGLMYEMGAGVDVDLEKGRAFYALSTAQGARGGATCWRSERAYTAVFV